jgi:hypothetical protein
MSGERLNEEGEYEGITDIHPGIAIAITFSLELSS